MFRTDHHFCIGQAHQTGGKPCQDYAFSGVHSDSNLAFAVVSDGCSSGRNTDVGARLLTLSTVEAIRGYWRAIPTTTDEAANWIASRRQVQLNSVYPLVGLSHQDMLATCIFACISSASGFIQVQGDGVTAIKHSDGSITMSRIEWPNNMPFYPAYLGTTSLNDFIQAQGGDANAKLVRQEKWRRYADNTLKQLDDVLFSLQEGINGLHFQIQTEDDPAFVAVFSDGATQIDGIDWKEAVSTLLSFKNTTGEFAKRRMIGGLKDMLKLGRGPLDDLAYAVIRVEPNSTQGV